MASFFLVLALYLQGGRGLNALAELGLLAVGCGLLASAGRPLRTAFLALGAIADGVAIKRLAR